MQAAKRALAAKWTKEISFLLFGSFLFGMAYNLFLSPGQVIIGGFTGIATLLHLIFGWESGIVILLLNLPFLIWNGFVYGPKFCVRTMISVVLTSLSVDYLTFFPISVTDPLLCAVLGASVMGIGCAILFLNGYTTGGSDLIAWLIKRRHPRFSTGRLILAVDVVIVLVSTLVLRNFATAFYAIIAIFIFTRVIDYVTSGADRAKLTYIFTAYPDELSHALLHQLKRGVTRLRGVGAFTGEEKAILLCVIRPNEIFELHTLVSKIDADAFYFFADVSRVVGLGFPSQI